MWLDNAFQSSLQLAVAMCLSSGPQNERRFFQSHPIETSHVVLYSLFHCQTAGIDAQGDLGSYVERTSLPHHAQYTLTLSGCYKECFYCSKPLWCWMFICYTSESQNVVLRAATLVPPGNLEEMQIIEPHPRFTYILN